MTKKYQITCTEEQLWLIASAVEDWHRFLAGQTGLWNASSMLENCMELRDELDKLQPLVTPMLGRGSSYSWNGGACPNKHQRKAIAMSYGIYRQILHFFAARSPKNSWNVYKSETLTCDEQGGLILVREEEPKKGDEE